MSQGIFPDINPLDTSGDELADILNTFRDAIISNYKGAVRPPELLEGGHWLDDSDEASDLWYLKIWTGDEDITLFTIDIAAGTVSVGGATGSFEISKVSADAIGPILDFVKSRIATSGQVNTGDVLGELDFKTTTDTGTNPVTAKIKVVSNNNSTSTQQGSYISFELTDINSASRLEKARLIDGKLGIGTTAPVYSLHVKGTTGLGTENEADTTDGALLTFRKKRVATNGQVLSGDTLAKLKAHSTDNAGTEISDAFTMEVTAAENHTSTAHGTNVSFKTKDAAGLTASEKLSFSEGVAKTLAGLWSKFVRIGTHATAANNVKLHRAASGHLQLVLGGDATAEGSKATILAQAGFAFENYLNASKPANDTANKGRVIYVSDTNKFEYDTGSAWAGLGGGALVVSTQSALTSAAAIQFSGTTARQLFKLATSSGEQDLSALSPQVQAATDDGQELILVGTSDTNYPILKNGNGLKLNGDWIGTADAVLKLVWINSKWVETGRS